MTAAQTVKAKLSRPRGRARVVPHRKSLFLPYQERWIKDQSRIKLMEKARQIGLSWSSAYALVRRLAQNTGRLDAWVSSRDEIQARLFLEDCKKFAEILHVACKDLGERVIDESKHSALVLQFDSGLRINSMSSNPDAQAGKRGSRLLDEFALHPDPKKLYSIAYPGITWGGQIEIVSTHRGSQNYFNRLIGEAKSDENRKGISLHTVTLQDALDQGFLYKLQEKLPEDDERLEMDEADYFDFIRSGCADEESFLQEYMCIPADDNSAFLPYELIDRCVMRADVFRQAVPEDAERVPGLELYIGVDIGRHKDLTVIYVLGRHGGADVYHTLALITLEATPFSEQEAVLYEWLALANMRRSCIDSTGIGMQFAERAVKRFGLHRVEAVNFSGKVKEELAYPLKAAFEDRTLRLPDDRALIADLRKIRKTTTAAGNIRFEAERDSDGHADRFWALALAVHAGATRAVPFAAAFPSNVAGRLNKRRRRLFGNSRAFK